jgi:GAF domain-containing protein
MFPREAGYESYVGMPIVGSDGRVLGHLAIFDTRPRGEDILLERIYRIFLARAAAEIERRHALQR